ncbi:nucleoside-diphosphate-sugar epimerase [Cellulophaga algicola DSM 14237]|uniref:Nucleoside-diphosphate-sugar epimerase n=1 Tax=Cellulophaga algicola (strain DSM 14237 / IC166 / ACAM 630) TaxID=688270 RepID=E6X7Y7_CELAD|nr:NAD(P)H-binding protein [Cellulophaga algicola]ADV48585.1 nucleoside-diphosphate-sugar epimerase [Cellulophaga algicola DSM 14237]
MKTKDKTAIILGATGLTGGLLLDYLLKDDRYQKIKLFSRSSVGISHPKIEEHLIDLLSLEEHKEDFMADEVFCCIGTTKKKTPDNETYKKIDYGIPVTAAKVAKSNEVNTFIVISALGASAKSTVFYNTVKGEMEDAVLAQKFPRTFILQPSLIGGERTEKRTGEWIFKKVMKVLNMVLIGSLKKYRTIAPETIAAAMIWLANNDYSQTIIESDKIKALVQ